MGARYGFAFQRTEPEPRTNRWKSRHPAWLDEEPFCSKLLQVCPGPGSIRQALPWIRDALAAGRYAVHEPHFGRRCRQRGLSIQDVKNAIKNATRCEPYADRSPTQDGTNWRVTGPNVDGDSIAVGVEAFETQPDRWVLLITLFEV